MKDKDTRHAAILNAIIGNTTTKIVFAMREPDDALYLARVLFVGHIDYAEYKPHTERPVVVGHHTEIVKNHSLANHRAEHQATSETESVAVGTARTHMMSVTEAEGESDTDATSQATARGTMNSEACGSAASSFDGASSSQGFDPTSMNFMFAPPTITSVGVGTSSGIGSTDIASNSSGSSATEIAGSSHAHSTSRMTSTSEAVGTTESEVRGYAVSRMRGTSKGVSQSAGEAETFVATLDWLPSELFSAAEQHDRLTGEIMNLAHRECFVKVANQRPVRTRTADLEPAFRSAYARRAFMPVLERLLIARSPYLRPVDEVDALLAARQLAPKPELAPKPDFSPEPLPIIDDPEAFAARFWQQRTRPVHRKPTLRLVDDDGDNKR